MKIDEIYENLDENGGEIFTCAAERGRRFHLLLSQACRLDNALPAEAETTSLQKIHAVRVKATPLLNPPH